MLNIAIYFASFQNEEVAALKFVFLGKVHIIKKSPYRPLFLGKKNSICKLEETKNWGSTIAIIIFGKTKNPYTFKHSNF